MRMFFAALMLFVSIKTYSQPNCEVYKMNNNMPCYEACLEVTKGEAAQGSKASQLQFDKAIELCPSFDYAYFEKAVPYLKRGDFIAWKKLIDRAVEIDPAAHLGYRGWCRFQFLRDYKGAIQDFEKLDSLVSYEIGHSINGDYQLNIAKALCYKAIGQKNNAIEIIELQLNKKEYSIMLYDYLHLGVLKMEIGDDAAAILYFNKSIAYNDYLAEPYYYLGLIYKKQHLTTKFKENMEKAKAFYLKGYQRFDRYTQPMDKVFLADIERELRL